MALSSMASTAPDFTQLADLLPVAVYMCDRAGVITYYNDRAIELWGRTPELGVESDVRFCGSFRLYRPDGTHMPHDETPMAEALRTGLRTREQEVVIERPDGSRIVVSVNIDPLFDDAGEITGAVNAFQDVTERAESAMALAESERRYRDLIDGLGVAVYTTDAEGRITLYNEAATDLWGRQPAIGKDQWCGSWKLFDSTGAPIRHEDCPMGVALRENRTVRGVEATAERPDGSRVTFLPFPTPMRNAAGDVVGAVNVLIDLTARRQAEQALQRRQAHLEAIFRTTIAAIAEIDPSGRFVAVNDRYCELSGRTRQELLSGMTKLDVTHPDDRSLTQQQIERLSSGEDSFTMEKRYLRPDGSVVWAHNGVSALRDEHGALTGAIAVVTDISALVHAMQELEEANGKKDEFLSLVSHELRTPITTILGNAKILADRGGSLTAQQSQQALEDVKHEAGRLNRIIENLLAIARLERGQEVETEPLLIGRVIKRIFDEHFAGESAHAYSLDVDLDQVVVECNEVHLEQVLKNLLSNAAKYSPAGGPVRVTARASENEVVISVEDSGGGIEATELQSVFDPFYRSARTANRAGLGIGLSVCRRLVEVMGGRIWIEGNAHGGSTFSFSLPRAG